MAITIGDVNDNAPYFISNQTDFEVLEGAAIGTFIGKKSALDLDSGGYGDVYYSVNVNVVRIDRNNGTLFLNSVVDREDRNEYIILVKGCYSALSIAVIESTC